MMRLGEFDDNATAMELPEKPLKEWRAKFEANSLMAADLMDYFHATSPLFFSIEHSPDYNELGNYSIFLSACIVSTLLNSSHCC